MSTVALPLVAVYLVVAFLVRAVLLRGRTGSAGWHGISGRVLSAEWTGGALFAVALLGGLVAPVLQAADVIAPVDVLDGTAGHVAGLVLYILGFAGSLVVQHSMGAWWRIGVDSDERTELVDGGPFAYVRNPFFTALLVTATGLTLLAPNLVAIAALVALLLAVELQVRLVEEPYLRRSHGDRYLAYARRVGRLIPRLGRLDPAEPRA